MALAPFILETSLSLSHKPKASYLKNISPAGAFCTVCTQAALQQPAMRSNAHRGHALPSSQHNPVAIVHPAGWPQSWQDLCQQGGPQLAQSMVTVNSSDASEQTSGMPEACSAQASRQPGVPSLQWPPRWHQQQAQQGGLPPQAAPGMPRSSSAPDVRLLVNTDSLPGPRNLLHPSSGTPLAGALVPYKGPEVS